MRRLLVFGLVALFQVTSHAAADPTIIPSAALDCSQLRIDQVDFTDCYIKRTDDMKNSPIGQEQLDTDKTIKLADGKFQRYPHCSVQASIGKYTARLFQVESIDRPTCAPFGPNSYCLSPEQHILANSPPCLGKTMTDECIFNIAPQLLKIPDYSYYDSRYQCTCYKKGCGQVIGTFHSPDDPDEEAKFKFPTLSEIQTVIKKTIPGCDDVVVKDVTPPERIIDNGFDKPHQLKRKEVDFAITSLKCPMLIPGDVWEGSCPNGFRAVRRLHVGMECNVKTVFAIACLPKIEFAADQDQDPCFKTKAQTPTPSPQTKPSP